MRNSLVLIAATAVLSAALAILIHATGALLPMENGLARVIPAYATARMLPSAWQYLFIFLAAIGVAWLAQVYSRRERVGWLVGAFALELVLLAIVCGLYRVRFQPLPSVLAALLSYGGSFAATLLPDFSRKRPTSSPAVEKLSAGQRERLRTLGTAVDRNPHFRDANVMVCDLANKFDLSETLDPAAAAKASREFTSRARTILLQAGAYIHVANPEGVLAIFGLLDGDENHATKAVEAAFELVRSFSTQDREGETAPDLPVHVGVSSGPLLAVGSPEDSDFFLLGGPIELARRFCLANRTYGSRILIGPRTFALASDDYVSRPIDFLTGGSVQERYEIYEPLARTADAPRELLARRDYFWNGVVLYREKRWAESYAEFQKARAPEDENDAPLHLYLRRLEPLALHLLDGEAS